jgi:hypothetical protein
VVEDGDSERGVAEALAQAPPTPGDGARLVDLYAACGWITGRALKTLAARGTHLEGR